MANKLTTRDGSAVSRFAFGAMQWGESASAADARATYEACRAAGINHFDTAHVYGDGASEQVVAELCGPERDTLYIATKVSYPGGNSRASILSSVEDSRVRLKMDQIDLLYLHRFDDDVPLEESFETLAKLQSDGVIRHIGVSNFAAWQLVKAQGIAGSFGTRIDMLQPMYNLVKRQVEVEILPASADQGIEVCSYSPLGGGLLTGKYARGETEGRFANSAMYRGRYDVDWMRGAAASLNDIAGELGTSAAVLAIAWLTRHAPDVRPILSARTAGQIGASIEGMSYALDDATYDRITALSPTPAPATDRLEEA